MPSRTALPPAPGPATQARWLTWDPQLVTDGTARHLSRFSQMSPRSRHSATHETMLWVTQMPLCLDLITGPGRMLDEGHWAATQNRRAQPGRSQTSLSFLLTVTFTTQLRGSRRAPPGPQSAVSQPLQPPARTHTVKHVSSSVQTPQAGHAKGHYAGRHLKKKGMNEEC